MSTKQVHNDYRMKCSECKLLMILRAYVHGIFRYMIVHFDALLEYYLSVWLTWWIDSMHEVTTIMEWIKSIKRMFGDETPYILQTKMFINTNKKKCLHKSLVVRVSGCASPRDYFCTKKA